MARFCFTYLLLLPLVHSSCGQNQPQSVETATVRTASPEVRRAAAQRLREQIDSIANEPRMDNGVLAFSLKAVKSGEVLVDYHANQTVVIASNMKVITTATALEVLGPDFRFETKLQYSGELSRDGTLNGNLYLRGGGDPTLGSTRVKGSRSLPEVLSAWAAAVKAAGIRRINGQVVGDASAFKENGVPAGWSWADLGNYFGAPALALNIHDNFYRLYFRPGRSEGAPTTVLRTEPAQPELVFVNDVKTGKPGSGDNAYLYGSPYTSLRTVEGTIPAGVTEFPIRGALPDPPLTAARLLHERLIQAGVAVSGEPVTQRLLPKPEKNDTTARRETIHVLQSPPLRDIINFTNQYSFNLYAEAILNAIGWRVNDEGSTWSGTRAVERHWKAKGYPMDGLFMRDGSGLSRNSAATAGQLADVLLTIGRGPHFAALYQSLPAAGVSGTMVSYGRGTAAQNNVRAKTGTIERVRSFSGYMNTRSGVLLCFALISNEANINPGDLKRQMEKIMVTMAELP